MLLPQTTVAAPPAPRGAESYYKGKIEGCEQLINSRTANLRRLEAQRNALNKKVKMLRQELRLLQEPASYVGEVVKVMGKTKVLVKVSQGATCFDCILGTKAHLEAQRENTLSTLRQTSSSKISSLRCVSLCAQIPTSCEWSNSFH